MDTLMNVLLRPYRSVYSELDLGRRHTESYTRTDGSVFNQKEQAIKYSYFNNTQASDVCVVYCHCNSGSRLQGVQFVEALISKGWNLCLFDFSGSGQSQGTHVSLGHFESRDLDCILRKMRTLGNRRFLLWGRSMGAASIVFYLHESKLRQDIVACVLDSPYASLWSLISHIGQERSMLPSFIIERALEYLRGRIKEEHCFDIRQLQPIKCISSINQPLLFITSLVDECVKSEDVVLLYQTAGSKIKQLQYIDKAHNAARDKSTVDLVITFMHKNLTERTKRKKQMAMFARNNKDLTGGNMADLIVKAEKERSRVKRMKSEHNLDKSTKENRNRINVHLKTQLTSTQSVTLNHHSKQSPQKSKKVQDKRKTIKFSLAHIQHQKSSQQQY